MRSSTNRAIAQNSRDPDYERAHESREDVEASITELDLQPSLILEAPPPRAGYVQAWKRVRIGVGDDQKNSLRVAQEGWTPRLDANGRPYHRVDCVLMERPVAMAKRRAEIIEARKRRLTTAVVANAFRDLDRETPGFAPLPANEGQGFIHKDTKEVVERTE